MKEGKSASLEIGIGSDADRAPIVILEFVDDPRSLRTLEGRHLAAALVVR